MPKLSSVKQGEKLKSLHLENKDEVLKVNAYLDSRGQTTKNQVRNLGVILETDLSFSSHVKAVTNGAFPLHGTVRFGTARYGIGTAQFGSVAFPPQFSTAIEWAGLFTRRL